jgi:hypothetical protein
MNPTGALLIPKLRSYFAEFLNECSLKRLRILSSSTCVGLRYGYEANSLEVFLGSVKSATLSSPDGLAVTLEVSDRADLPTQSLSITKSHPSEIPPILLRHPNRDNARFIVQEC